MLIGETRQTEKGEGKGRGRRRRRRRKSSLTFEATDILSPGSSPFWKAWDVRRQNGAWEVSM